MTNARTMYDPALETLFSSYNNWDEMEEDLEIDDLDRRGDDLHATFRLHEDFIDGLSATYLFKSIYGLNVASAVMAARHDGFSKPIMAIRISKFGSENNAHIIIKGEKDESMMEAVRTANGPHRLEDMICPHLCYGYTPRRASEAIGFVEMMLVRTGAIIMKSDGKVAYANISKEARVSIAKELVDKCRNVDYRFSEDTPAYALRALLFGMMDDPVREF